MSKKMSEAEEFKEGPCIDGRVISAGRIIDRHEKIKAICNELNRMCAPCWNYCATPEDIEKYKLTGDDFLDITLGDTKDERNNRVPYWFPNRYLVDGTVSFGKNEEKVLVNIVNNKIIVHTYKDSKKFDPREVIVVVEDLGSLDKKEYKQRTFWKTFFRRYIKIAFEILMIVLAMSYLMDKVYLMGIVGALGAIYIKYETEKNGAEAEGISRYIGKEAKQSRGYIIVKYYTIQSLEAWNEAQKVGYLVGKEKHIEEYFIMPYKWLMEQMLKVLPEYNGEYPVWVWPDKDSLYLPDIFDGEYVILEVELPEDRVMITNYDAWHIPLNRGYFTRDDGEELDNFYEQEKDMTEEEITQTKVKTWDLMLDNKLMTELGFGDEMQGTTGTIKVENIRVIKYIVNHMGSIEGDKINGRVYNK